jgi:hypothetical protein
LRYHNLYLKKYHLKQLCDSTYGDKRVVTYPLNHTDIIQYDDYQIQSWITCASINMRILLDKTLKHLSFLNHLNIAHKSRQKHHLDDVTYISTGYQEDIQQELTLHIEVIAGPFHSHIESVWMRNKNDTIVFKSIKNNNWLICTLVESYYNMIFAYNARDMNIKLPSLIMNHMQMYAWQNMDNILNSQID